MHSTLLELARCAILYTADAAATLLYSMLQDWGIMDKIRALATDNASYICATMVLSRELVLEMCGLSRSVQDFHVRCLAHVVHLAVKHCLHLVRNEVESIRNLIGFQRSSEKRRDAFERVCAERVRD